MTKNGIQRIPARIQRRGTDLEILRGMIGVDLSEIEPFFWAAVISNNNLDFYFGRMAESTLKNFADEATAGVSFLDSHNSNSLGYGQTLNGVLELNGEQKKTVVDSYTVPGINFATGLTYASTDDFIRAMQGGLVRDVSVGFYGGISVCDVCGEDIWEIDWSNWSYLCPHIPGVEYPVGEQGENVLLCTFEVEQAHLSEVSAVYDGATPGATIEKAQRMAEAGELLPGQVRQFEVQYRTKLTERQMTWPVKGERRRSMLQQRGQALADLLDGLIEDQTDDDTPRSDVIGEMAEAAGISSSTVNEILNEEIDCPPLERLEGFASVLDTSTEALVAAAEEDGCNYEGAEENMKDLEAIRALLGDNIVGGNVVDRVRVLVEENARLVSLADQGQAYRTDLIEQAMAEGRRAHGKDFAEEQYAASLDGATIEHIKRTRDDWQAVADERFGGEHARVNDEVPGEADDEAVVEVPAVKGRLVPTHAFRV